LGSPHVIVWDLDGTLGDFSPLYEHADAARPIEVLVRPGLGEALQTLSAAGFVHTVLTLATPLSAEVALRATGLRPFFVRVEGCGQRGKGDAAGLAEALGLAPADRPHRMLFVGDHPHYDEPRDPDVVFHLEPWAMARPADELARLVLYLRDLGDGSLRRGFDRLAASQSWWAKLLASRKPMLVGQSIRRVVPRIGPLLLLARDAECPIITFEQLSAKPTNPVTHTFVPAEIVAQVRSELAKARSTANGQPGDH
jgi:hypothetical protein